MRKRWVDEDQYKDAIYYTRFLLLDVDGGNHRPINIELDVRNDM
jgi:hypothetical protein